MDIFYFHFYLKTFFVDPISLYYFVFCFASNFICHGIHISRHYVVGINFGTSCSLACNVNIQLIMGGSGTMPVYILYYMFIENISKMQHYVLALPIKIPIIVIMLICSIKTASLFS